MEPGTVVWRDTAQSLLRHKWLIIGCVLLGIGGAAIFSLSQTQRWTASSQVVIGPAVPPALVGNLPTGADKTGPLGLDLPAETQARVMASPTILREVAKSLGLPTTDDSVQSLASVTRVKAVTDNAYLITIVPGRVAGLLLIAVLLPFWSSLLVRTFAWQVILRDTGVINRFLENLGLISEPLPLIRTTLGVIIGMSHVLLPFMVLPIYAVMRRIDPEFGRAAANLGASPVRAFVRVFVPLTLSGVVAGSLLVFVLALGFYITPALLGGARDTMISQLIVSEVQQALDWGSASAMAVLLMAITFAILFVASRLIRLRDVFGSALEE